MQFLNDLADQEAKAAARQRIHDWKDQISDYVPRLARWIKARSELDDSGSWCSDSPRPQLQAEKCARSWFSLRNPEALPVDQALDRFLEFTPACPNPWPLPSLQGHQLQHLCHQAIKKAPGLDCWLAKSWDCLPLVFFSINSPIFGTRAFKVPLFHNNGSMSASLSFLKMMATCALWL